MLSLMFSAIRAGLMIGLGGLIYLLAPNKIIGALCFSIGLVAVRMGGLALYTGQIQNLLTKRVNVKELAAILLGNFIGAYGLGLLAAPTLGVVAAAPETASWGLFAKGIGCGALMTIGTKKQAPLWVSVLAVFIFVYSGFAHSVAMAFYMGTNTFALCPFLIVVVGNLIGGLAAFSR